jgi:dihydrofolate reductase
MALGRRHPSWSTPFLHAVCLIMSRPPVTTAIPSGDRISDGTELSRDCASTARDASTDDVGHAPSSDSGAGAADTRKEQQMTKLTYINNMSLDGYVEDRHGAFDFGPMDDELFATYTDLLRTVGTFLYGRRLYEAMAGWETDPALAAQSSLTAAFSEVWQAPQKIVYTTTMTTAPTANTRIERAFDVASVQQLKAESSRDLTVGGADLASQALKAGIVDECLLFVWPLSVGDGKPALPADARLGLELLDERRYANGVLLVRYRPRPQ